MKKEIEEIQTTLERDEETLQSLGGEMVINDIEFPPPTTAVMSLLEIIESPFVIGFENASDIKIKHINEALYVLKERENAVNPLFGLIRFEKIAEKSPEFFEKYLKSSKYADFEKEVYKFAESLGVFDQLETIIKIQTYMNICFNAFDMLPNESNGEGIKKKEIGIASE